MTGKLVADVSDPKMEDEFWRKNWSDRKYIDGGYTYDQDYGPAHMYGVKRRRRRQPLTVSPQRPPPKAAERRPCPP